MSIIGVPTARISDVLVRQRLLDQITGDQAAIFRLEQQLSTGHRFQLPSEDAPAALRVMSLQQLLERKKQAKTNLQAGQSYLSITDTAMSQVGSLVTEARGTAISAMGTTATDSQRRAAAEQISQTISQLRDTANQKFRGRYLFAGTQTGVEPFSVDFSGVIGYLGNEGRLPSYGNIDLLFDTNVQGNEVFVALSDPVRGSIDLNPVLTYQTRLTELRGGQGISRGSIAISDGQATSVIDISSAETLGDLAALIRAHPPEGNAIDVEVTARGLSLRLTSGELSVREVGGGTTAAELGILHERGTQPTLQGRDLDPILKPTTSLDDILGTPARAILQPGGANNDLIFEADQNGGAMNGITVSLIDDHTVTAGHEVVVYDAAHHTLRVNIQGGRSTANQVIAAVNAAHQAGTVPFTAQADPSDGAHAGEGLVWADGSTATTSAGSGENFDRQHGLTILNGGRTHTISLATANTVEDVLNILNGAGAGILADINQGRTGIDVRSRLSGADFAIGENGGLTATQLGLRTFTGATQLASLNFGRGVTDYQRPDVPPGDDSNADFTITRNDGLSFAIDLHGCKTIDDVLAAINNNPVNQGNGVALVARLAVNGNGIELADNSIGPGRLTVTRASQSEAAIDLGLVPSGATSQTAPGLPGTPAVLTGIDANPQETAGLFTSLLRLQHGLLNNDQAEMQRAVAMLDASAEKLNLTRGELGARQQGLDALQSRLDTEEIEIQQSLSQDYDSDTVETVSNLSARQLAYQASLKATAQMAQLSLLNYL